MNHYEIFKRAIQIAEANNTDLDVDEIMHHLEGVGEVNTSLTEMRWMVRYSIIFNHDFAKALWGEGAHKYLDPSGNYSFDSAQAEWQYHLQQMVLVENPMDYLGEHL